MFICQDELNVTSYWNSCNCVCLSPLLMLIECSDGFDMEIIKDDEFAEPRLENFQREKLDDSCVMVEGDELRSLPQGTRKHMSYKVHTLSLSPQGSLS